MPHLLKDEAFDAFKEQNRKHWLEVQEAKKAQKIYEEKIEKAPAQSVKRSTRLTVPEDVRSWSDINFPAENKKRSFNMDLEAQRISKYFEGEGIGSEQGRILSVQKEHAISVAGDPKEVIKATPTQYGVAHRGSDYYKSQFSGSGRYNVRQGKYDSFTLEQMETIGRPKNWWEAGADDKAFKDKNMIDLDNQDWLRLQQGTVTDNELVSHKFWQKDQAQLGNIWIDANTTEELIQDIDVKEGKESLKRHYQKDVVESSKLEARVKKSKIRPERFNLTKLGIGEGLTKVSGKLSKADAMAQMGMNISTGNIPGALINAGALSAQLVGQSPAVQKRFAELAVKIVAERGAKTTAKLIPGVDVGLSAAEAWGYLSEGKLDQAGIAALSGAIGWVPGLGDFGAALLDATNTGLDIARLDINKKPEIVSKQSGQEIADIKKDFQIDSRIKRITKLRL
tara:strand:- start:45 stop:1400 length:1356 start_codon:yes stop_codon:yes gene_type:complete